MNQKSYLTHGLVVVLLLIMTGCGGGRYGGSRKPHTAQLKPLDYNLPTKSIKQTNRDEALVCKNFYKDRQDYDLAAKYLERLLTLTPDHKARSELILELADMYMILEQRDKACRLYGQYKALYPGSSSLRYVLYQELLATQADCLASNKDQTKTRESVKLALTFLKDFPRDPEYEQKVKKLLRESYLKLLNNELKTVEFYLNKFSYEQKESALKAAHKRIAYVLKEYVPHLADPEDLLALKSTIDSSSIDRYKATVAQAAAQLRAYVQAHAEPENGFLSTLFSSKKQSENNAQRTRS